MALKQKVLLSLIASLTLGLAPFSPEPHLFGKIRWLLGGGEGMKLMDYWDLIMHGAPWIALLFFSLQFFIKGDKVALRIKEALLKKDTMIIDVREPHEFAQGHAVNAVNMPLSTFDSFIPQIKKSTGTKILYCKSGMRSAVATAKLKKAGVQDALNAGTLGALK